ncbi:MAG: rRNA adenine N-6-methyltransferase family protein [bacterium]|jgi:16S rRNA (adenine1518-N6/adenine1519-N6)-dimethyltransferase
MLPIKHRKPLGQHFINNNEIINNISFLIVNKIKEFLNNNINNKELTLLEIGSSYGILSFNLINQLIENNIALKKIFLNEIDYRLIKKLELKISENPKLTELLTNKKIEIINIPFEKIDLTQLNDLILIGNIPFYITGLVLRKIIDYNKNLSLIVLNLQKEVVDKIKSLNNVQSIILNMIFDIEYHFIIHPKYYTPKPKVFSQIISFNKKQIFEKDYINKLYKFLDKIYKNKNKKIANLLTDDELSKVKTDLNSILSKRANNLEPSELINFFNKINN